MSSTVQPPIQPGFTPVPPQPPLPPRHRSFAGPVVLIIVGIVCLMGTMGYLSLPRMWHVFANYWPALLIVWGIIKLVEHQQAQREGARSRGIGAGGVLLIIMIMVFGLIAHQIDRVNWAGIKENFNIDDNDFNGIFGESYNFNDHLEQNFPGQATLKVIDNHGAVSVHTSNDDKITVVVRKRVGAQNQEDANKYNDQTKPTITSIGGLVTVDAKSEAGGDHPVETDLDISLPSRAPVSIVSRHGDVVVAGRNASVDISAQRSDTSVEDITGNVKVNQEKGSVKVEQVTGDVHVEGHIDELSVADVKGSAQLDGDFQESVKLARISKNVVFKSSRTDMEFSRIAGSLDLDSDDLHADEITGPVHLTTRSKNIRLEAVAGDVRLQNDNGTVEISMRTLGNVQIDNRNGDIQLAVPDKAGFRIDARTRGGEIQSDFPELKVENNEQEGKATGSVGSASSHIVLNNEHEGIEIRRAGAMPPRPPEPPAPAKAGKNLPAPKEAVEPTEN